MEEVSKNNLYPHREGGIFLGSFQGKDYYFVQYSSEDIDGFFHLESIIVHRYGAKDWQFDDRSIFFIKRNLQPGNSFYMGLKMAKDQGLVF